MQKILVTGGAGFIGSNFVKWIFNHTKDSRICVLDKLTYAGSAINLESVSSNPNFEFIKGDISDIGLVSQILKSNNINAVVNFAAETHVDRSIDSPKPFYLTNVMGTIDLLEAVRTYCKGISGTFKFLHVSTDEVYGSLKESDPAFTEANPYLPNSPYAASKASSDHIVRSYGKTYKLPVVTTNCSNNYGPQQFPEKLIPLLILNALEGKDLPIYGDGMNVRDWLYVDDHCSAVWAVLNNGKIGESYNVGGSCERTNLEILDLICSYLDIVKPREDGRSYGQQKIFVKDRPGHDRRYAVDSNKIKQDLNWEPNEDIETGIKKTVNWYLENLDWCKKVTKERYNRERLGNL